MVLLPDVHAETTFAPHLLTFLQELTEWISAFEVAKRKALEDPASTETSSSSAPGIDPAFAISPPMAPEFAAKLGDGHTTQTSEDLGLGEYSFLATLSAQAANVANVDDMADAY